MTTKNFADMNKTELRAACKAVGISYSKLDNDGMRAALTFHHDAQLNPAPAAEPVVTTPEPEVSEQRTDDTPAVIPADASAAHWPLASPPADLAPVEAAAEPAPTKEPKKPAAPRDQRNGISRPAADNKCGQVWAACDALKTAEKDVTFEALRLAVDTKVADATLRTQRQRWKQYNA